MKARLVILAMAATLFAGGVRAATDDRQGHDAGGMRDEHASEQGLEKGKAWAGSSDKKENGKPRDKQEMDRLEDQERSQKKEKAQKQQKEQSQKAEKYQKQEKTKGNKGK